MCVPSRIPPALTVVFDPDAFDEQMDTDTDAETIPWSFNPDAAEFVPDLTYFGLRRGTTRVWADMTDDNEDVPEQETVAQRNARRLEEARLASLLNIVVLDSYGNTAMSVETDGTTLVADVHRLASVNFNMDHNGFVLAYGGSPLTNGMAIATIVNHDRATDTVQSFHLVRRPRAVRVEFRTVEHGTIRLSVQLCDTIASLYGRISFLTGWGVQYFTLRHNNRVLDDWELQVVDLNINTDTHMVMVGALTGGTQRIGINSPPSSPCAAAAHRMDDSEISDTEFGSQSSTSMPKLGGLVLDTSAPLPAENDRMVVPQVSSSAPLPAANDHMVDPQALSSAPSVLVGMCPLHALVSSTPSARVGSCPPCALVSLTPSARVGSCPPCALVSYTPSARVGSCPPCALSSSLGLPAASGSAGPGLMAAAPPWVPSSPPVVAVSTLSVQGLKRTYVGAVDAAGRATQRIAMSGLGLPEFGFPKSRPDI